VQKGITNRTFKNKVRELVLNVNKKDIRILRYGQQKEKYTREFRCMGLQLGGRAHG
jgi:hypothetical protein